MNKGRRAQGNYQPFFSELLSTNCMPANIDEFDHRDFRSGKFGVHFSFPAHRFQAPSAGSLIRANQGFAAVCVMTGDQTRFYLREIHPYWTTAHISSDKVRELQRESLIEISPDSTTLVRLTPEGARAKVAGRPAQPSTPPNAGRHQRSFSRKATYVPAAALV